jgi:hypothetical protein
MIPNKSKAALSSPWRPREFYASAGNFGRGKFAITGTGK